MFNFIIPKMYLKVERWKWNKEYRIYVSNYGHFKDEHKQLLSLKISQRGYCYIYTNRGFKLAHRIVMLTWNPIPDAENLTVDHLDHNKRNNSIYNLEWVSRQENLKRANDDYFIPEYEKELSSMQMKINILKQENDKLYTCLYNNNDNKDIDKKLIQIYDLQNNLIGAFPDINTARDWFMKKTKLKRDVKICNTVTNNIKKAIRNNKIYGKYIWKGEI